MGILKKLGRARRRLIGRDGSFLSAAEAYRHLAVQLHFDVMGNGGGRCLMLTCPDSREQTEQATRMLAAFLAEEQEHNVLIIDGSFSANTLNAQFQAPRSPGLLNILDGSEPDFQNVVRATGHPNIFFLPAGESQIGPRKLLMSPSFTHTLDQFRSCYDFSLISTGSVLEDSAALAFPSVVDCVLLLIIEGVTRWPTVGACRTAMENCKARRIEPILGSR
jgi:succinoglycan biosynthesis transport protein ExoP